MIPHLAIGLRGIFENLAGAVVVGESAGVGRVASVSGTGVAPFDDAVVAAGEDGAVDSVPVEVLAGCGGLELLGSIAFIRNGVLVQPWLLGRLCLLETGVWIEGMEIIGGSLPRMPSASFQPQTS